MIIGKLKSLLRREKVFPQMEMMENLLAISFDQFPLKKNFARLPFISFFEHHLNFPSISTALEEFSVK